MASIALGRDAEAAGYRLLAFGEIASTSALARERARAGERGPLWITAERQTAGYGRRGSLWQSLPGNLAASLLVTCDAVPPEIATLGFAAGLAVHAAIAAVAPTVAGRIALKWPNDVLAEGAKLAGVLVETEAVGESRAVIGIGINMVTTPVGLPYPATSLAALGADVTTEVLFAALSDAWVPLMRRWEQGGFAALRHDWLARAMGLGAPLSATLRGEAIGGIFETVDHGGRLVLRGSDGARRTIAAGEVHFGDGATARAGEGG